jgi:hypothetical protein
MTPSLLFANPATRFFAVYGNTADRIATPALRVIGLRLWLNEYCRSLGYERVIFYSPLKKIHFADPVSAGLAQKPRGGTAKKTVRRFGSLQDFGIPASYPRLAPGRRQESESAGPAAAGEGRACEVQWSIRGSDADAYARLNQYMQEGGIPTALVFSQAEDIAYRLDPEARRYWEAVFGNWAALPAGNRNICICVFGRWPDLGQLAGGVLRDRFMDKEGRLYAHNCFCLGAARQDEARHLLQAMRLKREIAWNPSEIARAALPLAQSLVPDEVSEPPSTLMHLHQRILAAGNAPPAWSDPWEELRALPALERQVGERLRELVRDARRQRQRLPAFQPPKECASLLVERFSPPAALPGAFGLHLALLGGPGTGKTTLARLIGRICRHEGLLSSGHFVEVSASGLIAGYVGQTAIKTAELVQRAMGGVLFIDEAYTLARSEGGFADECVAELVQSMTRYRDFSLIIAGYTREIGEFLDSPETNPGLASRFPESLRWKLENYRGPELAAIFSRLAAGDGRRLPDALQALLPRAFDAWVQSQDAERSATRATWSSSGSTSAGGPADVPPSRPWTSPASPTGKSCSACAPFPISRTSCARWTDSRVCKECADRSKTFISR